MSCVFLKDKQNTLEITDDKHFSKLENLVDKYYGVVEPKNKIEKLH